MHGFRLTYFSPLFAVLLFFICPSFIFAQSMLTKAGSLDLYAFEQEMVTNNIGGFYDSISQKEYIIVSEDTSMGGLSIFDVTIPSVIQRLGHLNTSNIFGAKVYKNYVYTIAFGSSGIDIFDIADIQAPVFVNHINQGSHTMIIDDRGFLYISTSNGFSIYDLTNPANPAFVKNITYVVSGANWHDGIAKQNKLIIFAGSHTLLYDLSDPVNPIVIGLISDPNIIYSHSGDLTEDGSYLFICDEGNLYGSGSPDITIWDLSDLNDITKVAQIDDTTTNVVVHNAYVKNNYLYVAYYKAGFRVYNISNPNNPVLVDQYKTFGVSANGVWEPFRGCYDVYPYLPSGNIVALDSDSGLFVFSIDLTLGLKSGNDKAGISIFPNPFSKETTMLFENNFSNATLTVYDSFGRQIKKTNNINGQVVMLSRDNLAAGLYFVQLTSVNKVYTEKIIVTDN